MNELNKLKGQRAYLKLVAVSSTKFGEYLEIIEKTGIILSTPQRIELFIFSAFFPYLTMMLKIEDEAKRNESIVSFMSILLEYKPEQLSEEEFQLVIEAQESDEEDGTVLDYIHAYYESWINSLKNGTIEQDKRLTYAISGIHIKLASRLAHLSNKYQEAEDRRFEAMREGKSSDLFSVMREQSDIESSVSSLYMNQIQTLMKLTLGHLGEVSAITAELQ